MQEIKITIGPDKDAVLAFGAELRTLLNSLSLSDSAKQRQILALQAMVELGRSFRTDNINIDNVVFGGSSTGGGANILIGDGDIDGNTYPR